MDTYVNRLGRGAAARLASAPRHRLGGHATAEVADIQPRPSVREGRDGGSALGLPDHLAQHGQAGSERRAERLTGGGDWRSAAACRYADPDLFFPVSDSGKSLDQVSEAKAVCAGCPARLACLAFALSTRQTHGIWGGLTEQERYRLMGGERPPARQMTGAGDPRRPVLC